MRLGPVWRRLRFDIISYVGLGPFLAFALFPFYWMVITSFKADANLYDLKRDPFWFSTTDGRTVLTTFTKACWSASALPPGGPAVAVVAVVGDGAAGGAVVVDARPGLPPPEHPTSTAARPRLTAAAM